MPQEFFELIQSANYEELDQLIREHLENDGIIFNSLSQFIAIKKSEYIISIREEGKDEDGIWHDDGSRELAFTISLTQHADKIKGGNLLLREKGQVNFHRIKTPEFGTVTIMKTGQDGYEHCVEKVTKGKRIICAGWIN